MCPIFDSPQLSCLTKHQKLLREYSLGCKNLLNFTFLNRKLHNCHDTNDRYSEDEKSAKLVSRFPSFFENKIKTLYIQ